MTGTLAILDGLIHTKTGPKSILGLLEAFNGKRVKIEVRVLEDDE